MQNTKTCVDDAIRFCQSRGLEAEVRGDRLHVWSRRTNNTGSTLIGWDNTVSSHALSLILASFPLRH